MAYVVILHLSPDHESRLAEVLQLTAAIPVTQAQDRVRVVPNHVYVISPNQSLSMSDGHLALSQMTRLEERRAPVDIFFRTLAESHHSRAVCVILSGTGADGSMGMKRVKECGGVCIVQEPKEAEYSDMPLNSIATGLVDYVLPVAQIPAKIIAYKKHLGSINIPAETAERPASDDQALRDIFTQLRVRAGHDFVNYKRSTVLRRIERRISVHELPDLPSYARFLREQPDESRALLKDLLISVTNFFRDPQPFAALEENIIPKLFENKGADEPVRVWVAGCATGEEAYSMAMELLPDIVVMDVSMPQLNGLKATEKLKDCCPQVKVLTLTRHTDDGYLQQILRAGASGYVLKQSPPAELLHAIRAVAAGGKYLDPAVAGKVMGNYAGRRQSASLYIDAQGSRDLSDREAEVLRLIAWGHSNKEIAARLDLSVKTIEAHKANAMKKLGMRSRIDIVRYALLQGWLQDT